MTQNTAQQADARIVTIDPSHPLAELHMRAVMTWPNDRSKRDEAVATFAALGLAEPATSVAAHVEARSGFRTAVEKQGYTLGNLMNNPEGILLLNTIEQNLAERTTHFFSEEIATVGGIGAVARSIGIDAILKRMRSVERCEMQVIGSVLCFAVQIQMHHPHLVSSQNLAWAVFEFGSGGKPAEAPVTDPQFKRDYWAHYRSVAPLHAAYKVAQQIRLQEDPSQASVVRWSEDEIREIIGWAKWFRRWATTYKAKQAAHGTTFIPENVALIYASDVQELAPPLGPLNRDRLEIATDPARFKRSAKPSTRPKSRRPKQI